MLHTYREISPGFIYLIIFVTEQVGSRLIRDRSSTKMGTEFAVLLDVVTSDGNVHANFVHLVTPLRLSKNLPVSRNTHPVRL